jgi:tRNA-dihydrouridine synthase 3
VTLNNPILGRFPLAPLTRGGNLPFRRLCRDFGATATCSEMVYAHHLVRGKGRENALLRYHESEDNFGVQLAVSKPNLAVKACRIAQDRGAKFVDLNCGCPIYDTVTKGMGARLLQKVNKLSKVLDAMVDAVDIPITVKLRTGFSEKKINIRDTVKAAVDAGVTGIVIHGRTREQRYSRTADWELLAEVAAESPVPVWGNGDILTPMEARHRLQDSKLAGAVLARGALIKPWIFKELTEDREWLPTAEEWWALIVRFAGYLKEHFGVDDIGRRRGLEFLTWHLDWFERYRPLPESDWKESALEHPLLQTREVGEPLLLLPDKSQEAERQELACQIWDSPNPQGIWKQFQVPTTNLTRP